MVLEVKGLWKIVGIVSSAPNNDGICDLNHYVIYTDVSKFNEWIDQVVLETVLK
jgi:secreted trypsin-like serine protease